MVNSYWFLSTLPPVWRTTFLVAFTYLLSLAPAHPQANDSFAIPEIISSDMIKLDERFYPENESRKQTGERRLVSAAMFGTSSNDAVHPNEISWLASDFELLLPRDFEQDRICVEISNGLGTFRAIYLMKMTTNSDRVILKVDFPDNRSLIGPGGTFVAYPASSNGFHVAEACDGSGMGIRSHRPIDELVFPARVDTNKNSERHLYFKINSGGDDVSIYAIDTSNQNLLEFGECHVPMNSNGSYDRECEMKLNFLMKSDVRFVLESSGANGFREITLRIPD